MLAATLHSSFSMSTGPMSAGPTKTLVALVLGKPGQPPGHRVTITRLPEGSPHKFAVGVERATRAVVDGTEVVTVFEELPIEEVRHGVLHVWSSMHYIVRNRGATQDILDAVVLQGHTVHDVMKMVYIGDAVYAFDLEPDDAVEDLFVHSVQGAVLVTKKHVFVLRARQSMPRGAAPGLPIELYLDRFCVPMVLAHDYWNGVSDPVGVRGPCAVGTADAAADAAADATADPTADATASASASAALAPVRRYRVPAEERVFARRCSSHRAFPPVTRSRKRARDVDAPVAAAAEALPEPAPGAASVQPAPAVLAPAELAPAELAPVTPMRQRIRPAGKPPALVRKRARDHGQRPSTASDDDDHSLPVVRQRCDDRPE